MSLASMAGASSHVHAPRVAEDYQSGLESGVRNAPTFFIDGVRYDGPIALRDLLAAIRESRLDVEALLTISSGPRVPRVK